MAGSLRRLNHKEKLAMKTWKIGVITAVSALGMLAASAASAEEYYHYRPVAVARPVRAYRYPRYRSVRYGGRWVRPPDYVQPIVGAPIPFYEQPVYEQPTVDYGESAFAAEVRAELGQIEGSVRERVAAGQLDGRALDAMENARDDLNEDLVDVSAKGYLTDADRAHIQEDLAKLRQQFGC
jgi:hypothetical protein